MKTPLALLITFSMAALVGGPPPGRADDDDLREKLEKALRKAQKAQEEALEEEEEGVREFRKRVKEYAAARAKLAAPLPPLDGTLDAMEIERRCHMVAQEIRKWRKVAKPGDLFVPKSQPLFQRAIRAQLEGAQGAEARKRAAEGNPVTDEEGIKAFPIKVNTGYPLDAPLSTMPASVLLALPPLPPDLEYRFVGRHLLLIDRVSCLIVDFVRSAAPPLPSERVTR